MFEHKFQSYGHVVFIIVCLTIAGIVFSYPSSADDKNSSQVKISVPQEVGYTTSQNKVSKTAFSENQNKERPQEPKPSVNTKNNTVTDLQNESSVDFDDWELPMPDIELIKTMLSGWDLEADKLIENNDTKGLVDLKMRIVRQVPEQWRSCFFKADYLANSLEISKLVSRKKGDKKTIDKYIYHCKAALESLHKIAPKDPFYFLHMGLLNLREDPIKAKRLVEQGMDLLNNQNEPDINNIYYSWKLAQLKTILLSTSGKNQEAIDVVEACMKRVKLLPEQKRGIAQELMLVKDWLEKGNIFYNFVYDGIIVDPRSIKKKI